MTRSTAAASPAASTSGTERKAPAFDAVVLSSRRQLERTIHGPAPALSATLCRQACRSACQSATVKVCSGAMRAERSRPCRPRSVPALVENGSGMAVKPGGAPTRRG